MLLQSTINALKQSNNQNVLENFQTNIQTLRNFNEELSIGLTRVEVASILIESSRKNLEDEQIVGQLLTDGDVLISILESKERIRELIHQDLLKEQRRQQKEQRKSLRLEAQKLSQQQMELNRMEEEQQSKWNLLFTSLQDEVVASEIKRKLSVFAVDPEVPLTTTKTITVQQVPSLSNQSEPIHKEVITATTHDEPKEVKNK